MGIDRVTLRGHHPAIGRLAPELLADLRAEEVVRLLLPREHGGHEGPLSAALRVYEGLAGIDGPVAWIVWNVGVSASLGLLPPSGVGRQPRAVHHELAGRIDLGLGPEGVPL